MSVKRIFLSFIAAYIVITPSFGGDIISCESFENCPDGSFPCTSRILELEAEIVARQNDMSGILTWSLHVGALLRHRLLSNPSRKIRSGIGVTDTVFDAGPIPSSVIADTLHE